MAKTHSITGLDSQAPTARNARIILQQRLDDIYTYTPYIENSSNMQELHDLRIAAKRMRYTLELFEEFLPPTSKGFVEELARLQEELGALHDSEVMLTLLRQLLQPESELPSANTVDETAGAKQTMVISSEMARAVLHPSHTSALSTKERQGLASFFQRQEQRREQSYALFRQHWQELEQKRFREAILEMLHDS